MKQEKIKELRGELSKLLVQHRLRGCALKAEYLQYFSEFRELVGRSIVMGGSGKGGNLMSALVTTLIQIIREDYEQISISYVVKKLSFLQMLLHKSNQRELQSLQKQKFRDQIEQILKLDIKSILNAKNKKKEGSISKVYNIIRSLSGSKERPKSNSGKMRIEDQIEKGAIKEVLKKIIEPYAVYLSRIIEDYQMYWAIANTDGEMNSCQFWMVVNLCRQLGNIACEIHRICRYFKQDFIGLTVYLNYLISVDVAIYYDRIKGFIERRSEIWCSHYKMNREKFIDLGAWSAEQLQQLLVKENLKQLKEQVCQVRSLKQKINYIYCNGFLRDWQQLFKRPLKYNFNYKISKQEISIENVLSFTQKIEKQLKKNEATTLSLKQTLSLYLIHDNESFENNMSEYGSDLEFQRQFECEFLPRSNTNQISGSIDPAIFDGIKQQLLQIKMIGKGKKERLNRFILQENEKLKLSKQTSFSESSEIRKSCYSQKP